MTNGMDSKEIQQEGSEICILYQVFFIFDYLTN